MAKKDPGLSFKSEKEFSKEFGETMNPDAFKKIIEQLRANNLTAKTITADNINVKSMAEPIIQNTKEVESKKEEIKSNDKLIDSHKKLTTNIEKLTQVMNESAASAKNNIGMGGRGEELAKAQKIDYRSIGQRIKDKVMGRGGSAFDPESLRYKFGSLRGLATTTGLVTKDTGGIVDSYLARREERKQSAETLSRLNPQMKNLKQFGGDEGKARGYFESKVAESQLKKRALSREQDKLESLRASGMSDDEIARTTGGKRMIQARNVAAAEQVNVDPTMKGEKIAGTKQELFAGPDNDKLNVSQEEESQLKAVENIAKPTEELIKITKEENERKTKADAELLAAVKGIESSGGGALGGIADAASNLIGGKGGAIKKGAGYLSKVGGAGKLLKGVGIGAVGALAGEGLQYGGEKLKEAGYEQTGKAVGTAGTAAKYAGYGAMIGSVVPGVGTAIGGAVGGVIGAGKGIYDNYFANKAAPQAGTPAAMATGNDSASQVSSRSADNEAAKLPSNSSPSNTIVNAPTTVSKSSTNNVMKLPVRDQDHSIRSYYRSRFAT